MVLHKYNSEKHGYGIEKASHTRKKLQNLSDKRIKSRLYKEILNSIIRNPVKIHAYDMKRYFSKEEKWMANRHMQRYSTSVVIKEI